MSRDWWQMATVHGLVWGGIVLGTVLIIVWVLEEFR